MANAFGIVTSSGGHIHVEGLQTYRPIGAFSLLGRYRLIDIPVSNFSNSGIDRIQVYVNSQNPRSIAEHLGNGRTYNINPKRGKLQVLFNQDSRINKIYNTDIAAYSENISIIERMQRDYVVIAPEYMIFREDFEKLLENHIASGADVTLLYHKAEDGKPYRGCSALNLNRQKGVKSIDPVFDKTKDKNVFMDTYVMKRELFVALIRKAQKTSAVYTLVDILNAQNEELDIRGEQHKGDFAPITDFKSYFDTNIELLNTDLSDDLMNSRWPIYTVTTDSCPVKYFPGTKIKNSMVANGCQIHGTVENCVIGRGVEIKEGAVVKNCVILGHSVIDKDVRLEYQVVDKWAKITAGMEIVATEDAPGYIRRDDVI